MKKYCLKLKILMIILLLTTANPLLALKKDFVPDPEITQMILEDPGIVHSKLVKAMNILLHDPATLTINIDYYSDQKTSEGVLKKVIVKTSDGKAEDLMLHRADIEFIEVQLDTTKLIKKLEIAPVLMGEVNMDVEITEKDLNEFLDYKSRSIRVNNPRVDMKPGKIELSGSTRYGVLRARFWASGHFSIANSSEIWFHADRMRVNHMAMPRSFIRRIIRQINPVLNLDHFPFEVNLREIRMEDGKMVFTSFQSSD